MPKANIPVSGAVERSASPASFTPGPWFVDPDLPHVVVDRSLWAVCNAAQGLTSSAVWHANARLIAVAPELLEACKALQMEAAARGCGLRIADEAIAKAEGR